MYRRTPPTNGRAGGAACVNLLHSHSNIEIHLEIQAMKTLIAVLTFAVVSLTGRAADVTGTWKAEFETQRGLQKYTFTLRQDGTSVTGKANVERDGEKREAELKEGKAEGDNITFVEPDRKSVV